MSGTLIECFPVFGLKTECLCLQLLVVLAVPLAALGVPFILGHPVVCIVLPLVIYYTPGLRAIAAPICTALFQMLLSGLRPSGSPQSEAFPWQQVDIFLHNFFCNIWLSDLVSWMQGLMLHTTTVLGNMKPYSCRETRVHGQHLQLMSTTEHCQEILKGSQITSGRMSTVAPDSKGGSKHVVVRLSLPSHTDSPIDSKLTYSRCSVLQWLPGSVRRSVSDQQANPA